MNTYLFQIPALLLALILFILIILMNLGGYYVRRRELDQNPDQSSEGLGPVEGSLLGLLALLLSFTFSMSANRNEVKRDVMVKEANAISTAILRCDLYPDSIRKQLRADFNSYVNERITYYNAGINTSKLSASLQRSGIISGRMWSRVMGLSQDKDNTLRTQQMVPALNDMMDIVTTRDAERATHVPESILWMLFLLTLAGSFIIGYGSKSKRFNWIVSGCFALMTALTIYLILDLDRPRRGIINMDKTELKIVELKELLK